jgi:hypothetical protein
MSACAPVSAAPPLDLVEATLRDLLKRCLPADARASGPGRPEVLSSSLLWTGLLVGMLRGGRTQTDIWRLLSQTGLWNHPQIAISAEGVRKRLVHAGSGVMDGLFAEITRELAVRTPASTDLAPQFAGIYAIDDTTLDQVARTLPSLRTVPAGDDQLLPGKLSSVIDVRTQQFVRVEATELPHRNPNVALPELVAPLPVGSLVVFDLGYFSFEQFDRLSHHRLHYVSRLREKTSLTVIASITDEPQVRDQLVWLGRYRTNQAGYAVRLIEIELEGVWYRYVTNVLDPAQLSVAEVVQLYARRWDIELAFKTLKVDLGVGLLWSAKWELILTQVWAALILYQIVQSIRMQIAHRAEVDPFDVSLKLLLQALPQLLRRGEPDPIGIVVGLPRGKGCFIRPSSRTTRRIPPIQTVSLPPPETVITRLAHYAGRKSGPNRSNIPPKTVEYGVKRLRDN